MKHILWLFALCLSAALLSAQNLQGQELPKLAVVQFDTNINIPKVNQDAVTVRNLVESRMVATGKYQVITRTDIDRLLDNQQIQISSISSSENIRKLQLQNISYIVTGSVDAIGDDYAITVKILDVSTGQFSHSNDTFIGSASREFYNGVTQLASTFAEGMISRGGQVVVQPSVVRYNIGDRGPAGGLVFYDKGSLTDGWRFLEAAPEDLGSAEWGPYGHDVSGTSYEVGTGKRNTQLIVAYLQRAEESDRAAQLCTAYRGGGYDDWFLPSKDELDLMYQNLKQRGLGGFSDEWYWSSSQVTDTNSWVQDFRDDDQDTPIYFKFFPNKVRCVRSF
jgi:hypothetical protein